MQNQNILKTLHTTKHKIYHKLGMECYVLYTYGLVIEAGFPKAL